MTTRAHQRLQMAARWFALKRSVRSCCCQLRFYSMLDASAFQTLLGTHWLYEFLHSTVVQKLSRSKPFVQTPCIPCFVLVSDVLHLAGLSENLFISSLCRYSFFFLSLFKDFPSARAVVRGCWLWENAVRHFFTEEIVRRLIRCPLGHTINAPSPPTAIICTASTDSL